MAWIESHQELGQHPKTKRLARALQVSLPAAVGHLQYLWWWALDYAQDGDLSKYTDEDIADAICWDGDPGQAIAALTKSGFVDEQGDGTRTIHDWYEYAGRLIDQRQANRERSQRARNAKKGKPNANGTHTVRERNAETPERYAATVPDLTQPDLTVPNQTGQDTTATATPPPASEGTGAEAAATAATQPEQVPYKKIMELYNATCTRMRKIKTIDGERKKAVSARYKTYGMEGFATLFEKARDSEFLNGGGQKNWTADFDWLMNATNIAKVLEDKYHNDAMNLPGAPSVQSRQPPSGKFDTMGALRDIIADEEGGWTDGEG